MSFEKNVSSKQKFDRLIGFMKEGLRYKFRFLDGMELVGKYRKAFVDDDKWSFDVLDIVNPKHDTWHDGENRLWIDAADIIEVIPA